jgi:hypothetical protein
MTSRLVHAWTLCVLCLAPIASAQSPAPPPAAAGEPQPPPAYPLVRVGGLSYLQYDEELTNRDGYNAFDVTRAYLNVNVQVSRHVRFRLTPDLRRVNDGSLSGSLVVRIKYAFAEFDDVTPKGWVRLGAHQTPWLDFEEGINGYRVQGTMFSEREGLIPGSSDFGASYFTPLPGGYGEIHAGVFNGEGYTQPEANKYKSVQLRLTVRPLPRAAVASGIRMTGFYNAGWYAAGQPRRLGIVMGSFEHTHLVATLQGVKSTDNPAATPANVERSGWSLFASPRQGPAGWAGLVRYDKIDRDRAVAVDSHHRLIAGGAYWFVWPRSRVGVVVTGEQVRYDLPTQPDENRILAQTQIDF